jgi:hypothetical protein
MPKFMDHLDHLDNSFGLVNFVFKIWWKWLIFLATNCQIKIVWKFLGESVAIYRVAYGR